MTTVEMDDDDLPLILINHLGMQRWLARGVEGVREGGGDLQSKRAPSRPKRAAHGALFNASIDSDRRIT